MAVIYAVANGNVSDQQDVDQYKSWLVDGTNIGSPMNMVYSGSSPAATITQQGSGGTLKAVNSSSSGGPMVQFNNDQGSNNVLELKTYGSLQAGTNLGLTDANYSALWVYGTQTNGLILATLVAKPLVFGTNNAETGRAFSSGGWYLGGAGSDPGAGNVATAGTLKIGSRPAFVSGDKYLIVDSSGNVHVSSLGPAS